MMEAELHPCGGLVAFRSRHQAAQALPATHPSLFEVLPPAILHHPAVQELVVDSFGVFGRMHEGSPGADGSQDEDGAALGVQELVATSQFYRDLLKRCMCSLKQSVQSSSDLPAGLTADIVVAYMDQLLSIHVLWSLCEFLYFSPADCTAAQEMIRWAESNFHAHDDWLVEMTSSLKTEHSKSFLSADDEPSPNSRASRSRKGHQICLNNHPRYWDTVFSFLFYGKIEKARNLLSSHAQTRDSAFRAMDELLQSIPITSADTAGQQQAWARWRALAQRRLTSGKFTGHLELETVCKMVSGDTKVLLSLHNRGFWSNWYQFFIPYLLYVRPTTMPYELEGVLEECLDVLRSTPCVGDSQFDEMLMCAFSFESSRVVQLASEAYTDWWFPVHFHDLLKACGSGTMPSKLELSALFPGGCETTLGEHLMLEYASSLMRDAKLWEVGLAYLDHCPVFGSAYAELLIERIPLETEEKAKQVLQICELKDMKSVGKSICRQRGMAELRKVEPNVTKALQWCIKGQEPWFASFLATKCLQRHGETGLVKSIMFLDHIGDSVLMAPGLGFLVKYRQFYCAREEGKLAEAAHLLSDLILSQVVPKEFWHTLFRDLVPFLTEDSQGVGDGAQVARSYFDTATVYGMMAIVNDYCNALDLLKLPSLTEQRRGKKGSEDSRTLSAIREGLTLSLSAAILQESEGVGRMEQ